MDAARSRDPDNWQYAYGQAIVYGVSGRDPRPYAARGAAAQPARPARPLARARPARARRRRPAGARSRGGPGFRWSERSRVARRVVRRRRTRPPASSARPPSRTGIAAKPVNGSWLVWAAAACWRSAWVSSAGSVPPPPVVGASPPRQPSPPAGAFSSSAGRTPPSPQMSDGVDRAAAARSGCRAGRRRACRPGSRSAWACRTARSRRCCRMLALDREAGAGRAEQHPGDEHPEDGKA